MSTPSTAADRDAGDGSKGRAKGNVFARIALFVRQVIDEMRKVVWPTRHELVQYTIVVLIFLAIVMAYIVGIDKVFENLVDWLFSSE